MSTTSRSRVIPNGARRGANAAALRIGSMLLTFAATVWLAHSFSVAEFGAYSLALLATFAGSTVVDVGAGRVGLRRITGLLVEGRRTDADALVRSVLPMLAVTAPVGGLSAAVMCALITPRALVPLGSCLVVGVAAAGAGVLLSGADLLRAQGRSTWANAVSGRNGFLPSLLLLVMVLPLGETTLTQVLWLQTVAFVLPSLPVLWWLYRHPAGSAHLAVREWVRSGRVFMWNGLAVLANARADLLVAGIVLSSDAAGEYSGAVRLASLVGLPQLVAQMALIVDTSRLLHEGRTRDLERRLRRTSSLLLGLCAPAAIALVAPRFVLRTVLGPGYTAAAPALVVLCIAQLVNVATGLSNTVLSVSGHERVTLRAVVVAGAATVGLGWLAGWQFGGTGIGVASAAASCGMYVYLLVATKRQVDVWTHPAVFPPYQRSMSGAVA